MTTVSTAIPVTVVSSDTELLRDLSWTLSSFGYKVTASSDWSDEAAWRLRRHAGVLVLDGRDADEATQATSQRRDAEFSYRMVLRAAAEPQLSERFFAAGADDVVDFPLNVCELLTRLRSGVRRLELERRRAELATFDTRTGLLTRNGLIARAEQRLSDGSDVSNCQLVFFGCDFTHILAAHYGQHATRNLTRTVARKLATLPAGSHTAVFEAGRFATMLDSRDPQAAKDFVADLGTAMRGSDTLVRLLHTTPTFSAVIVPLDAGKPAAELVDHGLQLLDYTQSYGGGVVLPEQEVEEAIETWKTQLEAGEPFQDVVARDVMEAFPTILAKAEVERIVRLARRSAEVASPPCVPVVGEDQALVGILNPLAWQNDDHVGTHSPSDVILPTPGTVRHDQPISEVFDEFAQNDCDLLVIVDNAQPLGYVTRESLAALIADPIDTATYFDAVGAAARSDSLVVPLEPELSTPTDGAVANRGTDYDVALAINN